MFSEKQKLQLETMRSDLARMAQGRSAPSTPGDLSSLWLQELRQLGIRVESARPPGIP